MKRIIKIEHRVFIKVFAYTMLLLVLMSLAAVFLFSREFLSFYRAEQRRQLSQVFQPMISVLADKSYDEIIETARWFANNNQSYRFVIQEDEGRVIFATPGAMLPVDDDPETGLNLRFSRAGSRPLDSPMLKGNPMPERAIMYVFTAKPVSAGLINYGSLIRRSLLALGFMLLIAVFGAFLFAFKITKPLEDEIRWVRAMEESQRLFFSAASHELKTPIASARALVEGMAAGVGDYKDHPKYLNECLKTLDAQGNLVSEILDIVKLSDAQVKHEAVSVDLAELGGAVLAEYKSLAERKGLLIEGGFKKVNVNADYNLLRRVISNVLANAVQNTGEGQAIRIETGESGRTHVRLSVLNTGAQIPQDALPRLYDPFYRIDAARTRGTQTGLGLTIVKKALDRMKFPFGLENTGEGVLFWTELPLSNALV